MEESLCQEERYGGKVMERKRISVPTEAKGWKVAKELSTIDAYSCVKYQYGEFWLNVLYQDGDENAVINISNRVLGIGGRV